MKTQQLLHLLFIFFLTGFPAFCMAQQIENPYLKSRQMKANINLLGADISYEQALSRYFTIYATTGLSYGFNYQGGSLFGNNYSYALAPLVSLNGRWYYSMQKRIDKGKKILNNSGNFFRLGGGYQFSPVAAKNYVATAAGVIIGSWGLQRSIGKHFSFEGLFGLAAIVEQNSNSSAVVRPNVELRFGYIIF